MPLTRQQKKDCNILDLEPYPMASKELIDAKLEALEMHMEDRLRALFVEFRLGRSSSPRRSQRLSLTRLHDHHKFVKDDDKIGTLSRGCQKRCLPLAK
ncbi:hypothetical protein B296_00051275 [Ensete ventricosum]|uniref:Uncharacterized protein n=1 Tax=Ensete ventricosum TaxID=4639 RepID=A0A426X563_ENSVE|nr:hypothetical protein B296_00051275 [Ensete ventricosum]